MLQPWDARRNSTVYNAEITSLADIRRLQDEVSALRQLFDGDEANLSDFESIRRQLDDLEANYCKLDGDNLNDAEFEALLNQCVAATEAQFGKDLPPLDNEAAYGGIARTLRMKRREAGETWMRVSLPQQAKVLRADAQSVLDIRTRLQSAPKCLTTEQMALVNEAIRLCNQRLDELEVEGLVARYQALSEAAKQIFLERIGARNAI